jgi:VWFA-related protein
MRGVALRLPLPRAALRRVSPEPCGRDCETLRRTAIAQAGVVVAFCALTCLRVDTALADSRVVRLDLIATDRQGRTVENLKPTDFDLSEDGTSSPIDEVRFVKIDRPAVASPTSEPPVRSALDEQAEAAKDGVRVFAFFLDEYHVSGDHSARVRDALTHFVLDELGPGDLAVVMKPLDSLLTICLTRDRDALVRGIELFQGRKGDYTPRTDFERQFLAGDPSRLEQARVQVTTSALNALATHLGTLGTGRKTLVLVSEGFSPAPHGRGLEALPTVNSVIRSANQHNVSIYALDPADPEPPGTAALPPVENRSHSTSSALLTLATDTAGQLIVASDDLDAGMRGVASDSSRYYLLTYRSTRPDDGLFRAVSVRSKRPGVQVRVRSGYWAPFPEEARENWLRVTPATPAGFNLPWRISPMIRTWFGLARGVGSNTRVTFVWEPVPQVPGDRPVRAQASRVELTVLSADGSRPFEGVVLPAGTLGGLANHSARRAVFDVPPGSLSLKMTIEDESARPIDSDVREMVIRDMRSRVAVGSPEFLRARNEVEFRSLAADSDSVPVAGREFVRTDILIVRVAAYAPDDHPRVTARLLNRLGQSMRDLPVTAGGPDRPYQLELRLASLPPGEYFIETTLSSSEGDAKDLTGFRVTG